MMHISALLNGWLNGGAGSMVVNRIGFRMLLTSFIISPPVFCLYLQRVLDANRCRSCR